MGVLTKSVSILFVALVISFGLAALTSVEFAVDRNTVAYDQHVYLGVNQWLVSWTDNNGNNIDTGRLSYTDGLWDQLGLNYLGSENSWKQAGLAALVLGSIGIVLAGIALAGFLISFIPSFSFPTIRTSFLCWAAGFCFVLGAIIYEAVRPTFHGNLGYEWGYGLYLTCGVGAQVAAFIYYYGSASDRSKVVA